MKLDFNAVQCRAAYIENQCSSYMSLYSFRDLRHGKYDVKKHGSHFWTPARLTLMSYHRQTELAYFSPNVTLVQCKICLVGSNASRGANSQLLSFKVYTTDRLKTLCPFVYVVILARLPPES